ncbi:MAG: hypothetical protein KGZ85_16005 [Ignavibacterium sp.]|nr:hypothetical protein [Ignavibacterium sp.]
MNKTLHKIYIGSFFLVGITVLVLLGINGYSYYTIPIEERFFHSSHQSLKPSGIWGHGFGIIGTLMMIFGVSIYMIRKRSRRFFTFGYLKHWLEFHIFLCTVGPILVLYHTSFKFGGIVSVSFWSMVLVVLSGIIGRFIYIQIPRTIQGKELDVQELNSMRQQMSHNLYIDSTMSLKFTKDYERFSSLERYANLGIIKSLVVIIADYFRIKILVYKINKQLKESGVSAYRIKEILRTVKTEIVLTRRIGLLKTMQKLFRYWHIAHLPFAIAMFVIMIIHVAVTVIFGYKWIF